MKKIIKFIKKFIKKLNKKIKQKDFLIYKIYKNIKNNIIDINFYNLYTYCS